MDSLFENIFTDPSCLLQFFKKKNFQTHFGLINIASKMHSFCVTTVYFSQFSNCRFASFTSRTTHWKKDLCLNQQFLPILSRACPLFYTLWNEWVRHGTLGCKIIGTLTYSILVKSVSFSRGTNTFAPKCTLLCLQIVRHLRYFVVSTH